MSDEFNCRISAIYTKNGPPREIVAGFKLDATTDPVSSGSLSLTTSYEVIPLGDVSPPNYAVLINRGSVNVLVHSSLTGGPTFRLKPGVILPFPPAVETFGQIYAKAESGNSILEYFIF